MSKCQITWKSLQKKFQGSGTLSFLGRTSKKNLPVCIWINVLPGLCPHKTLLLCSPRLDEPHKPRPALQNVCFNPPTLFHCDYMSYIFVFFQQTLALISVTRHSPVFSHLEEQCDNFRSQLVGSLFLRPDGQHMRNEEKQKTESTRIKRTS